MSEVQRDTARAVLAAIFAALCLVALAVFDHKPCYVPDEQKIGSMKIAEQCGTERERQAINE